jgi:dCMP deaminase
MKKKEKQDLQQEKKFNATKWDKYFMDVSIRTSELSYAKKLRVGAVIAFDKKLISSSFNGTFQGLPNITEDENGNTLYSVVHAEFNAIMDCLRNKKDTVGATIYTTTFPCINCTQLIIGAGIKEVVYLNDYRDMSGLHLLNICKVKVRKFQI